MTASLLPPLGMLASFMALLLATFLFVLPSRNRLANAMLGAFLVATAIDISVWFMGEWWAARPGLAAIRPIPAALQMPLFTGFIWYTCRRIDRLNPRDAIHVLPAFLILIFVALGETVQWLGALLEVQYFLYIGAAIRVLWQVRTALSQRFAGRSRTWRWLALLVASSLVAHLFYLARTRLAPAWSPDMFASLQILAALFVLAITLWIAFQALLQPDLFRGGDRLLASAAATLECEGEGEDGSEDHRRLLDVMETERLFLDPDLTLTRLARKSGIPAKTISQLINQRHGAHFFDFINRYRIDHAKTLLAGSQASITDILYASGFNAKSSFNTAFRKHAGMTPSAYRKMAGK